MDNKKIRDNKIRQLGEVFTSIFVQRIMSCGDPNKEIIGFPRLFSKICTSFQISKKQAWTLLYYLSDAGVIQIVCGHGVKINYKILQK